MAASGDKKSNKSGRESRESREERLKAALKANMAKRKAQARARTAPARGAKGDEE